MSMFRFVLFISFILITACGSSKNHPVSNSDVKGGNYQTPDLTNMPNACKNNYLVYTNHGNQSAELACRQDLANMGPQNVCHHFYASNGDSLYCIGTATITNLPTVVDLPERALNSAIYKPTYCENPPVSGFCDWFKECSEANTGLKLIPFIARLVAKNRCGD